MTSTGIKGHNIGLLRVVNSFIIKNLSEKIKTGLKKGFKNWAKKMK